MSQSILNDDQEDALLQGAPNDGCIPFGNSVLASGRDVMLVGNGGSLAKSGLGHVIDQFETVVRFNNFVLGGDRKEDVGEKIDVWATNEGPLWHGMKNENVPRGTSHLILVPYWKQTQPRCWERAMDDCPVAARVTDEKTARGATDLFLEHPAGRWASTGLLAILHFARRYRQLYLAGFDFFSDHDRHHYWESGGFCGNHDGRFEAEIVRNVPELMACDIYCL